MQPLPSLDDLIGIEHCKLGFFQELRQKLEELQASNLESERRRQEISAILDGITDLMMVLSADMRIVSVNHVFRKIMEIDEPEGSYCYELFRNEAAPCPECPAHRSFRTGQVCRETAIFKVGGRNRQFEMVASPIRDSWGGEEHILIFKRDVTMEKEYQAKFYQAEKMATIGMLAAGVAHEINNPLAAISGFAEGIKRRMPRLQQGDTEPLGVVEDYLDTILRECERCQEIVHSLLTFSRPVSAGFSPLSLNDIVADTLKLLKSHLKNKDNRFSLRTELAYDLPLIYGDEPQLKQVLLNLLTNAMDALNGEDGPGPDQGCIVIRTYADGADGAGMVVSDNGSGIPPESLDKLFEPFYTTKPVGKGVGIGLSTCYGIVKEHCGEILVFSEQGKGSRFIVRLPANPESHSE